jgi:hypothetical protein
MTTTDDEIKPPPNDEADDKPCCGGYREHRYSCPSREWPATATPEIRRQAVRGDSIAPANAKIQDLLPVGLDYAQRKHLTAILAGVWDHGREYGSRLRTELVKTVRLRKSGDQTVTEDEDLPVPNDESRDWEQLRSDAIAAVMLTGPHRRTAERVVDAVLSVIDDETVRALCADHIRRTNLRSMEFRNGATMQLEPARELVALWVGASRALLDGAENYSETTVTFGIPEDPQRYAFVVQKAGKLTPHEARRKAEAERDELQKEVNRLRDNAAGGSL